MLRQLKDLVLMCLAVLLIAGFLTGVVDTGYLLGLLIVACLFAAFVPKTWKPLLETIGTLFGIGVLACVLSRLFTSLSVTDNFPLAFALLFLSLLAYIFRKVRQPKTAHSPRLSGAERTPVLPPHNEERE